MWRRRSLAALAVLRLGEAVLVHQAVERGPVDPGQARRLGHVARRAGDEPRQVLALELADDPGERANGLMFRESMPKSTGMLFVFPAPKHATFWMKNTPLALDIIFADQTGRVTRVHKDAVPFDESQIDGGPGVAFALEINAGLVGPMGISPGAVLRHPAIGATAAWTCEGS